MNKLRLKKDMPREQWLRLRKRGIGGSDAGVIMGVSPYRSIIELWYDKVSDEIIDDVGNESTYWGNVMEPIVREEFARRSGLEVQLVPFLLQHEKYTFMLANLDGMVHDPVHGKCVFEAKTSSAYKAEEWENGIPDTYYAQLQHYLAVTGWAGAYIAALIGGNQFIYRFVPRDDAYITKLIKEEAAFWSLVTIKAMPDADGSKATAKYLKVGYPEAEAESSIILDNSNQKWVEQYNEANAELTEAKRKKDEAENNLKLLVGKNESAYIGKNIIRWSNVTSQRLDTDRLKMELPDVYEAYLKESNSRRFSVKVG